MKEEIDCLYKECFNNTEGSTWLKAVVTGAANVGKTSLIRMYCEKKFSRMYQQTVGIDFAFHKLDVQGREINMTFWDMGGNDCYRLIRKELYKNANICVMVYDESDRSTLENLVDIYNEVKSSTHPDKIIIIGNKADKKQNKVKEIDLEKWKNGHNFEVYHVTATKYESVKALFDHIVFNYLIG